RRRRVAPTLRLWQEASWSLDHGHRETVHLDENRQTAEVAGKAREVGFWEITPPPWGSLCISRPWLPICHDISPRADREHWVVREDLSKSGQLPDGASSSLDCKWAKSKDSASSRSIIGLTTKTDRARSRI